MIDTRLFLCYNLDIKMENTPETFIPNSRVAAVTYYRTIIETRTVLLPIENLEKPFKEALFLAAEDKAVENASEVLKQPFTLHSIETDFDVDAVYLIDSNGDPDLKDPLLFDN